MGKRRKPRQRDGASEYESEWKGLLILETQESGDLFFGILEELWAYILFFLAKGMMAEFAGIAQDIR